MLKWPGVGRVKFGALKFKRCGIGHLNTFGRQEYYYQSNTTATRG